MKKHTTVLFLCGMLLLADYVWFGLSDNSDLAPIRTMQATAAVGIVLIGLLVYRKTYARQKKPASRRSGFAIVQPLRRLFVSVWP